MNLLQKFEIYHAENPIVYELFKKRAREARNKGYEKYSANIIFANIRWHIDMETVGDQFKMNNNYRAFYSRKMMNEFTEYEGFFETREQRNLRDAEHKLSNARCALA